MKRTPLRQTRIRSLAPGESPPLGEPRRYEDRRGYVRLRWKVGKGEYVETYERDDAGVMVRTKAPAPVKAIDWDRAIRLYEAGMATPAVAAEVGCHHATLSRGLRARGVAMRRKRDYEDSFDPAEVLRHMKAGRGIADAARLAGTTYPRAAEVVKAAGLSRRPGRPKGKRQATYEVEFRKQRPVVIERSDGRCEARVDGVCTGRVDHVHHRRLRRQGGTNELTNLLAVCHACHTWIHANTGRSYELGLLVRGVA